ncbi:MAG: hypothetical protein EBZ91_01255 [Gammaproteobacteria bacterium]|nr:hypothetical protein [Gammaproteobacteria bacterium]
MTMTFDAEPDSADLAAIRQVLAELENAWRELDFAALRGLWDETRPPVYFAEEAPEPLLEWSALQNYWDLTRASIEAMGMRITAVHGLRQLAPDIVSVVYAMHWDARVRGAPTPLGGDNRVCATLRRTNTGWRFIQYVESPLAPIVYMKRLYEQSVTPGFT